MYIVRILMTVERVLIETEYRARKVSYSTNVCGSQLIKHLPPEGYNISNELYILAFVIVRRAKLNRTKNGWWT